MAPSILDNILCCLFSIRIEAHLLQLGVYAPLLDKESRRQLYDIERHMRRKVNSREAAIYFFSLTFSHLPQFSFTSQRTHVALGHHALSTIQIWVSRGKIRPEAAAVVKEALHIQIEEMEDRAVESSACWTF